MRQHGNGSTDGTRMSTEPRDTASRGADGAPRVRSKVWVERGGTVIMSEYRAQLLEAVEAYGSVAAAAQALGLPYRTAWKKLREMEEAAGLAFVASDSGGRSGGGSVLTPAGREMLEAFRRVAEPVGREVDERFRDEEQHFRA